MIRTCWAGLRGLTILMPILLSKCSIKMGQIKMVNYIKQGDIIFAIIIKNNYRKQGIEFFTPQDFSQQLGYMNHKAGHKISPHLHVAVRRDVYLTKEVLFVKSGKVKVNFYDENKTFFSTEILDAGDVILLASGGHGFEILEDAEIFEVKQGPYAGDQDKIRFNSDI